ncbi:MULTISPECIES: DUF2218 domain-containing protein [unclassified Paracoccus (in: a-proteobacteria)]|uniref:DUF2218 domain-containing protein n=1 Tax=unclassified Paracoccus (in: a-proteobacteria) TaxID=2688777 RepID=UPI001E3BE6BE|nr:MULTISPECIES: DUF2218 domain-containing protein [unclassified Paracoccus (in: a-proteobacteria)]UXU74718.1 DUF2218 domain-containing protein [Paracoccus sp. SMMA_5]UXU80614.1 DUF2218 domain-containing protein [Paracoccus sp. SMMA_5_TC]
MTMDRSTCRVATPHASRYLQQLCKHWAHKFQVSFDPQQGRIELPDGRLLEMTASAAELHLCATAPAADMAQFQDIIAKHIAGFGFREQLVFDWQAD